MGGVYNLDEPLQKKLFKSAPSTTTLWKLVNYKATQAITEILCKYFLKYGLCFLLLVTTPYKECLHHH